MLVLLTNDDGVDASGLTALESALPPAWRVVVVAPSRVMSMCGHRVTTESPLKVRQLAANRFSVDGTPADCVRLALARLLPEQPAWVFSGINHGGNLGADLPVSGTVAAVREAAFHGLPGIAFSHYRRRDLKFDWEWAAVCCRETMQTLTKKPLPEGTFWNVNLPHVESKSGVPPQVHCPPSRRPLPVSFTEKSGDCGELTYVYNGIYAEREREEGSDIDVCFNGAIAISRIRLQEGDLTE